MHSDGLDEMVHGVNSHQEALRQEFCQSTDSLKEAMTQLAQETKEYCDCKIRESLRFNEETKQRLNASYAAINNVQISVNTLGDTLRMVVIHQAGQNREMMADVATRVEHIQDEMKEQSGSTIEHIKKVFQRVQEQTALCVFFVKGIQFLQDTAAKYGESWYDSKKLYLRGYFMSPGIHLVCSKGNVKLYARLRLYKGDMDDVVQWPFEHQIKLSVMHPDRGAEHEITVKAKRAIAGNQRPVESRNSWSWFSAFSINMNDLKRDGYVNDDQIRVKWEVLP